MIVFGYAKDYYYTGDSTLVVRVRIPSIHGPFKKGDAKGKTIRNYVEDRDLPYYQSLLLPRLPNDGDVVALANLSNSNTNTSFIVLGLTGASYYSPYTDKV